MRLSTSLAACFGIGLVAFGSQYSARAQGTALDKQISASSAIAQRIDPKAVALLSDVQAKLSRIHTVSAVITTARRYPPDWIHNYKREFRDTDVIRAMRPNYARTDTWETSKAKANGVWRKSEIMMTSASDGQNNWSYFSDGEYRKSPVSPSGKEIGLGEPLWGFFGLDSSTLHIIKTPGLSGKLDSLRYIGAQTWNQAPYRVVEWVYEPSYSFGDEELKHTPGGKMIDSCDLYIGADNLIHRIIERYNVGWEIETTVDFLQTNAEMAKSSFAYHLPVGAHLPAPPPPLLANGVDAPDFTVAGANGEPVHLADLRGQVVVLDFWSTWCGPCQASLPATNELAAKLAGDKVVFLAVNVWDTVDAYKKWLPEHQQFRALHFAIDPTPGNKDIASTLYKVSGIPTQYVIDPNGKIIASIVGYSGDEKALATAVHTAEAVAPASSTDVAKAGS